MHFLNSNNLNLYHLITKINYLTILHFPILNSFTYFILFLFIYTFLFSFLLLLFLFVSYLYFFVVTKGLNPFFFHLMGHRAPFPFSQTHWAAGPLLHFFSFYSAQHNCYFPYIQLNLHPRCTQATQQPPPPATCTCTIVGVTLPAPAAHSLLSPAAIAAAVHGQKPSREACLAVQWWSNHLRPPR